MPIRGFAEALCEVCWGVGGAGVVAWDGGDRADQVGVKGWSGHCMGAWTHHKGNKA